MQVIPYLSFNGQCEEAFTLYARVLGGTLGTIFRYAGSPMANQVPDDWQDKVMHTGLKIGPMELNGADVAPPGYEPPTGFSLALQLTSTDDAERIFGELAANGTITVPLEQTFWAARFGMVVDRFGIPWMINCDGSGQAAI
jgi:PhnB protein